MSHAWGARAPLAGLLRPRSVASVSAVEPRARIPALDGLRGIAILLVMIHHFTLYGGMRPATLLERLYYRSALVGWVGVDLFFVLSGFLITGILCTTVRDPHYFRNFFARRFLRIFPLYYGTLAVFFFVLPRLFESSVCLRQLVDDQAWYWSYLVNFQIAIEYWPECHVLGHFWSLAVEEQFYLLWPFLVLWIPRRRLALFCAACMGGALLLRLGLASMDMETAAYVLMPTRADALAVGALLAIMTRTPAGARFLAGLSRPASLLFASALGLVFLWRRGLSTEDPVVATVGFSLVALLFGAVTATLIMASGRSWYSRLLSRRELRLLGRYSYALYVFHHPIAIALGGSALGVAAWPRVFGSLIPAQIAFTVGGTLLSLALAMLSWHLFEAPILRLKRYFEYDSVQSESESLVQPHP